MTSFLLALTASVMGLAADEAANPTLPTATQLVHEALEECKAAGAWGDWVDSGYATESIAAALYDLGRTDEAKRLALQYKDENDQELLLQGFASLVAKREGASSEFERLISNEAASEKDSLLGEAIAVMVERRQITKAEQLFDRLGRPYDLGGTTGVRIDPIVKLDSGSVLASALMARGDRERARKYVRVALDAFSRWDGAFQHPKHLHDYAPLAIELGETEPLKKALVAIEVYATIAQGVWDKEFCPGWFACAGRWWTALGDEEKARHDFATAERYLIGLADRKHPQGYAELASQARLAGFTDLADEWTNEVVQLHEARKEESDILLTAISRSLFAGDRVGADVYLAKMTSPYQRASGTLDIAQYLIRNDDQGAAKAYLADAAKEVKLVTDDERRCALLQESAELHHQLNDDQAAGEFIQTAAREVPNEDGSLWSLATTQMAVGRFREAYATIHRISRGKDNPAEVNYRLWAIAELAAAVAEDEAAKRPD